MEDRNIPLLDCPVDYLIGDASGKIMNEYGRFPCKIQCGVYAFMVRGKAKATINITQYDFNEHDALLLEPGSFLLIHEFTEDALVYYVLFSSAFLDKHNLMGRMTLDAMQLTNPVIHLDEQYADMACDMFHLLLKATNTSILSVDKMVSVFNILWSSYAQEGRDQQFDSDTQPERCVVIFQKYTELVCKHYREWHQVSQYASAMRITLPHLCSSVRKASGRKAGDIINEAIMTDAKAQLKISDLTTKEIAMSLGFDNEAFFYRYFKSHAGQTPKAYRNN
ncbi:MAG: helix-turn-helix transcriptional regulator [Paludibacteraceae bacterium]|nr:helix-turn-helix transcriptional regulator [Paludibacteraceae bacterium]